MPLKKDISSVTPFTDSLHTEQNGHSEQENEVNGHGSEADPLDMCIVGAGFAGVYLLHQLRQRGFKAKIIEVGLTIPTIPTSRTWLTHQGLGWLRPRWNMVLESISGGKSGQSISHLCSVHT